MVILGDGKANNICPKCLGEGTIPVDTPFSGSLPSADCPEWPDNCGLCTYSVDDSGFDQTSHKTKCTRP